MDKHFHHLYSLSSTSHLIALLGIYFSSKYTKFLFSNDKIKIPASILFLFANVFLYRKYTEYFIKKSFEKKYREVENETLDQIIKTLEVSRLKIR